MAREEKTKQNEQRCPSTNYLIFLEASLGCYSLRSFLQAFQMVVNQEKSIQVLPEKAKISLHSCDKCVD